jgi:hypothetical protein
LRSLRVPASFALLLTALQTFFDSKRSVTQRTQGTRKVRKVNARMILNKHL